MSDLGNKEVMALNIKYFMNINNVNQTEVCSALNLKMPTFSDWVNAKTYPRIDKIELMANYFGIEKSDLVENRDVYKKISYASNNPVPQITKNELNLLKKYNKLNSVGKEKAIERIDELLSLGYVQELGDMEKLA
jgi:hypothetical protein